MDDDPDIWPTESVTARFYKQYPLFLPIETLGAGGGEVPPPVGQVSGVSADNEI